MSEPRSLMAFSLLVLSLLTAPARAETTLTYADLIHRMTDLTRLAELPQSGEKCAQWSSYDRASRYDEATGKYVQWDANGDGQGVIRTEGNQIVMAEMKGPGCIWRIWSADAQKGHVKIYLDGQAQPAVNLPFADYFDGKHAPFAYPALSYNLADVGSSGQNLYLPIPYQKSCKIVADKGWGNYFHFNYTTYPAGTVLPTFSAKLADHHAPQLNAVNDFLTHQLGADPAGKRPHEETALRAIDAAPGTTTEVARLDGPQAISAIWVKAKFASREEQISALRKLVLRITWDGQPKPAVWCPLGDFFGTAPGVNPYKTLLTGMTDRGFYSYWYMPFGQSAVVELVNEDKTAHHVEFAITHAPLGRPFAGLGHFHAKWHRDTVELPRDRWPDWIMLQTQGRGRFCGVSLHVWNPWGGWWGEGDEKFFVDGEKFPSTFGTGSEDYFGYAWGNDHLFQKPYHAQTMTQGNKGHQGLLRWHMVENVPFQRSFEGCIEKYFNNDRGTLYACTARWYLSPDGVDPYSPVPVEQRDGYYTRGQMVVAGFKILNQPNGNTELQRLDGRAPSKWKNDEQLWWTEARPNDKLVLAVPVAKAGKYEVIVSLTKARDYGIVRLSIDDKPAGSPIDLYNPDVVNSGPINLGVHDLSAGPHRMTVEIVGANPKAIKSYMFGIDRIDLKPVRGSQAASKVLRDIPYVEGGHERNRLDLYLPEKAAGRLPLIVWIHGGGWEAGSKEGCPAAYLTSKGYVVASINYRYSRQAVFPAQIEDCKAAIRWLRAHAAEYSIDSDHIGVWGASAGGHLVALLGTTAGEKTLDGKGGNLDQSSRVQCVVDWFGPTDLVNFDPKFNTSVTGILARLLGVPAKDNPEKARVASPLYYVSKDSVPFLIVHGDVDGLVPLSQSQWLAEALKKAGVEVRLLVLKGNGHGGPDFVNAENIKIMEEFFARHLGKKK